jgi:hypothetical protein
MLASECREGWSARPGTRALLQRAGLAEEGAGSVATSEDVRQTALDLAERGEDTDQAVRELLACCGDHRVSVVVARRTLSEANGDDPRGVSARAMELLDVVLERGTWA